MRIEPVQTQVADGFSASKPEAGDGLSRLIEALRNHIARLERTLPQLDKARFRSAPWTVGIPEIDSHLATQGLARHGLHDVSPKAYGDMPAAMGVSLAIALRRLADPIERRPLLWCRLAREVREYGNLYGYGLETLGLSRHRFVTVTLRKPVAAMWVAEEALKSGALALVIVDTDPRHASLTATRRLALAAHAGKAAGLIVFAMPHNGSTASHTRWVAAASRSQPPPHDMQAPGSPSWNLELTRARGGRPGAWVVEWQYAAHRFNLVSKLRGGEIYPWTDEAREITTSSRLALRAG